LNAVLKIGHLDVSLFLVEILPVDKKWMVGTTMHQTKVREIWESATTDASKVATIKRCKRKFKPLETRPLRTVQTRKNNDCGNE